MRTSKSIEQLENDFWKDIDYPTGLIESCHKYRKIPISELTIEQLRLLIGQKIGLKYILPEAVTILDKDVLAEGDHYPGDLLNAMLTLNNEDWRQCPTLRESFHKLVKRQFPVIESIGNRKLLRTINENLL